MAEEKRIVPSVNLRAAALLEELYSAPKLGVEVGVYKGRLSRLLLANDPMLFLFLVDPWKAAQAGDSYTTTDDHVARFTQDDHDAVMAEAMDNVREFEARCKVLRMPSVEASKEFKDGSLDFVFIDADHSYEGCKADIEAWWPKVRPRGLICGHDYRDDMNFGVIKAVNEAFGDRVRLGQNYTWFVTR